MAYRSRFRKLFAAGALMALAVSASLLASGAGTDLASLRRIGSRVEGRSGVVTIEASDPAPFVTSQPDPLSFVVELRDVAAPGYTDNFTADPRSPISAMQVESTRGADGTAITRVHMSLTHPVRPRVRSASNLIVVTADRPQPLRRPGRPARSTICASPGAAMRPPSRSTALAVSSPAQSRKRRARRAACSSTCRT